VWQIVGVALVKCEESSHVKEGKRFLEQVRRFSLVKGLDPKLLIGLGAWQFDDSGEDEMN